MTHADAKKRHAQLVEEIRRHDRAYDEGHPVITDYEYDRLERELLDLERDFPNLVTPDSPSQRVRGEPLKKFEEVPHRKPMLSLDKLDACKHPTPNEELDWERRAKKQDENTVRGYHLLSPDDFKDPSRFAKKLTSQADPVSDYIWNRFSDESRQVVTERDSTDEQKQLVLANELNKILSGNSIYDSGRFAKVNVPIRTQRLASKEPKGREAIRLNRLLLEAAYFQEISPCTEGFKGFEEDVHTITGKDEMEFILEPKVDGVSISVHYHNGKFALGVTRGKGDKGYDITANLKTVRTIPLELRLQNPPALLEVRGEAYISQKDFADLNADLAAVGEAPFPNARNATAGTLKQLDSRLVAQRPISAVFYAVGAVEGIKFETHAEVLESLKKFGLPAQPHWWLCRGMEEVLEVYAREIVANYDEKKDLRSKLPYEIDGIVIKVNSLADWERIPAKTKAPGYAIVHKPIPWIEPAETILKTITVQVGRTGVLTPVAELEPVFVQGSTIARATLHNEDEIRRKDIRIGDTVVIRKAGMVIPEVVEVVKAKRPRDAQPFDFVAHIGGKCPACGGAIAREKISGGDAEEVAWRCQNVAGCPAQLTRRVEYFAQRKALDLESLGGIVAEKLVERGLVKEPLDLFDLKLEQLGKLNLGTDDEPRVFGEKNATKILEALQRAKTAPLSRWIQALAIPDIGEQTALDLAGFFPDLPALAASSVLKDTAELGNVRLVFDTNKVGKGEEALSEAEKVARKKRQEEAKQRGNPIGKRLIEAGFARPSAQDWQAKTLVGPVSAKAILDWAVSDYGQRILRRMRELQIQPLGKPALPSSEEGKQPGLLTGKTFVLTGTLPTLSRDEASALIREAGGNVTGSVSKNTDFLLAGEEAGSKLDKAKELGTRILTEKEFLDLLGSTTKPEKKKQSELL